MAKKGIFKRYELEAFDKFYFRISKARAEKDLILCLGLHPYSFRIIALEIKARTRLGRRLLDKIKDMRLI